MHSFKVFCIFIAFISTVGDGCRRRSSELAESIVRTNIEIVSPPGFHWPQAELKLGTGWNSFRQMSALNCVNLASSTEKNSTTSTTTIRPSLVGKGEFSMTSSYQEKVKDFKLDVNGKYQMPWGHLQGSLDIVSKDSSSSNTLSLTYKAEYLELTEQFGGLGKQVLTETGKRILETKPQDFAELCGTHMVDQIRYGERYYVTLRITSANKEIIANLNGDLEAESLVSFLAKVKLKLKSKHESLKSKIQVEFEYKQDQGTLEGFRAAVGTREKSNDVSKSCSSEELDECLSMFNTSIAQITNQPRSDVSAQNQIALEKRKEELVILGAHATALSTTILDLTPNYLVNCGNWSKEQCEVKIQGMIDTRKRLTEDLIENTAIHTQLQNKFQLYKDTIGLFPNLNQMYELNIKLVEMSSSLAFSALELCTITRDPEACFNKAEEFTEFKGKNSVDTSILNIPTLDISHYCTLYVESRTEIPINEIPFVKDVLSAATGEKNFTASNCDKITQSALGVKSFIIDKLDILDESKTDLVRSFYNLENIKIHVRVIQDLATFSFLKKIKNIDIVAITLNDNVCELLEKQHSIKEMSLRITTLQKESITGCRLQPKPELTLKIKSIEISHAECPVSKCIKI